MGTPCLKGHTPACFPTSPALAFSNWPDTPETCNQAWVGLGYLEISQTHRPIPGQQETYRRKELVWETVSHEEECLLTPLISLSFSTVQLDSCGSADSGHPEHQDRTLRRHEQWGLPLHFGTLNTYFTQCCTGAKTWLLPSSDRIMVEQ